MDRQTDIVGYLLNDILPAGRGYIAMLKAYLDRGARTEAGRVMCVGAALFESFHYDRFLHEWQPILTEWGATAFHATDFYPGGGEFKRTRPDGTIDPALKARHDRQSREIPVIVGTHVHQLFVITFHEDEYEAIAPKAWRDRFGNVHRIAAQLMAGSIGHWANREPYDGEIAYFYETGDEDEAAVDDALRGLYKRPDQRAHTRMASTPIGVDKGKARGLEVADFLAWQWNKYVAESMPPNRKRPIRKDIQLLMDVLHDKGKKIDVKRMTGKPFEDFLIEQGCTRKIA